MREDVMNLLFFWPGFRLSVYTYKLLEIETERNQKKENRSSHDR